MSTKEFTGRHSRRRDDFSESVQRRKNDPGLNVSDILERVGRPDMEEGYDAHSRVS